MSKQRSPRNQTITLDIAERNQLRPSLLLPNQENSLINKIATGEYSCFTHRLNKCIDLLILDPPYNLNKSFGDLHFKKKSHNDYSDYLDKIISDMLPTLKPNAIVYICGDWRTSGSIYEVASKYFKIQNRITWEREKGRGSTKNWKNSCEDIWFCTVSDTYYFDADAVKIRRKVLAPYKNDGCPKDWKETEIGDFRDTYPSNFWNDITIPFWSMPENTDHPTQKSEKLIAKLVLSSSKPNDLVLDPFSGSGTTAVVCQKLKRNYIGIDINEEYCLWALKRLKLAEQNQTIQGYENGVFWERNSKPSK